MGKPAGERMKWEFIITSPIWLLLSGCSTSKIICHQWRNKIISDERALEILGVQLFSEKRIAKNHFDMIHAYGRIQKKR